MVETMIDLLQDKNDRIRRTSSNFLDVVRAALLCRAASLRCECLPLDSVSLCSSSLTPSNPAPTAVLCRAAPRCAV